eukprot:TRINITY_DN14063_c0_g4_i1.p3 TRINITY_DN14063_c0_g4~~TRINITY_DN14063_c0_g4_i1.p3  ORF type:complete len:157 (+),score=37.26 TRINITY_DN14063_c0_g4_i1:61-531(+)
MGDCEPLLQACAAVFQDVLNRSEHAPGGGRCPAVFTSATDSEPSLVDFLRGWAESTGACSMELLHAVVYVDRMCVRGSLKLTRCSVHRLLLGALVVAAKYLDDHPFTMEHYAGVGGVDSDVLQCIEQQTLGLLNWRLWVDASLLKKYEDSFTRFCR